VRSISSPLSFFSFSEYSFLNLIFLFFVLFITNDFAARPRARLGDIYRMSVRDTCPRRRDRWAEMGGQEQLEEKSMGPTEVPSNAM